MDWIPSVFRCDPASLRERSAKIREGETRPSEPEREAEDGGADDEEDQAKAHDVSRAETHQAEQRKATEAAAAERDQVRAELVKVQAKAEAAEQAHQEQRKAMAAEAHRQAERLTAAQGERDQAKRDAAQAREEAAGLRGRLEALGRPARERAGPAHVVATAEYSVPPWFDGITVYVQSVDAEVRAQTSGTPNRIDSGVRLWNGRGPLVSLSGATYPGRTGFSFATNDAAYIVGHFNAANELAGSATYERWHSLELSGHIVAGAAAAVAVEDRRFWSHWGCDPDRRWQSK